MVASIIRLSLFVLLAVSMVSIQTTALDHVLPLKSFTGNSTEFYPEMFEFIITEKYAIFDSKKNTFAAKQFIESTLTPLIGYKATHVWLRNCMRTLKNANETKAYVAVCTIAMTYEAYRGK